MKHLPLLLLLAVGLASGRAAARTEKHFAYTPSMVWTTCVRLLRVDYQLEIVEKDRGAGYIVFEYREAGMASTATFEFVDEVKDGQAGVKVMLIIAKLPSYMEKLFLAKLGKKLKDEYGPPHVPPSKPLIGGNQDKTSGSSASQDQADEDEDEIESEPEETETEPEEPQEPKE